MGWNGNIYLNFDIIAQLNNYKLHNKQQIHNETHMIKVFLQISSFLFNDILCFNDFFRMISTISVQNILFLPSSSFHYSTLRNWNFKFIFTYIYFVWSYITKYNLEITFCNTNFRRIMSTWKDICNFLRVHLQNIFILTKCEWRDLV